MNKKSHFTHAIQFKFLLLRIFIATVILLVSVSSIFFIERVARNSSEVIETYLPLLQEVQHVHDEAVSLQADAETFFTSYDSYHPYHDEDAIHEQYFYNTLASVRATVETLKKLVGTESLYIKKVTAQLTSLEQSFANAKAVFEVNVHKEYQSEEDSIAGQKEMIAAQQTAVTDLASIIELFKQWESVLLEEMYGKVALVNQSNLRSQILIVLISFFAVLLTLIVGLRFSKKTIVHPLEELTATAEEIAHGKLARRVAITSDDEIGKLGYTFNLMATKLQSSYDDLEKIVAEKTVALEKVLSQFESKNEDLEKSQMATINLLEDLEEEKRAVEERVKQRTAELEREKNKLLQVTSNMRGGGVLLDDAQEVVFVNDEVFKMLGLERTVAYKDILGYFLSHFTSDIKVHFKKCIEGNTFHVPEIDGKGRVYEIFFHHLQNRSETAGYFILWFDITDAKLLERSKSELVAVASHQLRTPLTAMRGNVEMLIDESFGALNKEQHELLDDIDVSTIRLITMVNEMLDITKIERGDLEMHMEKLNIKEIIDSVVADLEVYAARHEFTISETLQDDIVVEADRVRLRQVFQNLVDNSIKYSNHPGKLEISASISGSVVEVIFKDNGIGVPINEQPKLFERFYRASNTARTASSGSGLGLYIVKSIAEQLGGDIRFESTEGKGTTFFVTLPLKSN